MNMVSHTHSPASTGAPYLAGNFAPLKAEVTAFGLDVIGRIPPELNGRFLKMGLNPVADPDPVSYHWFTGTGMAHGLRLREGKAEWFRSRFVVDRDAAVARGREPIGGPGQGTRDGSVNTNFMNAGRKLCAIVEAGSIPVELNYELESVARTDFDGTLEAGFTGHAKFDPITGEQHALAYEPGQPVRYISFGRADSRILLSLGLPLIFVSITLASYDGIPPNKTDQASAMINAARNTGGSIGVSIVSNVLAHREQFHQSRLAEHALPSSLQYQDALQRATQFFVAHGSSLAEARKQAFAWIGQQVQAQAAYLAYVDVFWVLMVLALLAVPLALTLRKVRLGAGAPMAH